MAENICNASQEFHRTSSGQFGYGGPNPSYGLGNVSKAYGRVPKTSSNTSPRWSHAKQRLRERNPRLR